MVNKSLVSVMFMIAMLFSPINESRGQNAEAYFKHQIDSLDNITSASFVTSREIKQPHPQYTIRIKTQKEFDALNNTITKALQEGYSNIRVLLSRGTYFFHENHIRRKNEDFPNVSIAIEGKHAVLTSDEEYKRCKAPLNPWTNVVQLDTTIEVVDVIGKLCRVPSPDDWERRRITKVQVPQWYKAPTYKVKKIDNTGVYFVVPELSYVTGYKYNGYSINIDYLYKGIMPRYRLYDESMEPKCKASKFIYIENSTYMSFSINGLHFNGNKAGNELITLGKVNAERISICDCRFENIRGIVALFSGTGNILIDNNTITETDGEEIKFVNGCNNVKVTNNLFDKCGRGLRNTLCVTCWESVYYIADNVFRDFGYGAVGVGVWEGTTKTLPSQGIIEHNEIYYTPSYFSDYARHTLMDSGAIYTWTQNDDVLIRYNYIHNYNGAADNRGIFCDDGASNIKIYGNKIINTPNSYCIASRQVKDQRSDYQNNSYNLMAYNIIDGAVCFMGYGLEERHCRKGSNFILDNGQNKVIRNRISNLEIEAPDICIKGSLSGNQLVVSKKVRKQLKSTIKDKFINAQIVY